MRTKLLAIVISTAAGFGALAALGAPPAAADPSTTAVPAPSTTEGNTFAGGSDVPRERIEIPQGGSLENVYWVMADNPTADPITAAFRTDAPQGISVIPDQSSVTLAPGTRAYVTFSVRVSGDVPAGDYDISVGMTRSDIPAGGVPIIPRIAPNLRLRIGGTAVPVTVQSIDRATKRPVDGELVLERVKGKSRVPVGRAKGAQLDVGVVPGQYEASFRLSGREAGRKAVTVEAGGHPIVQLLVDAVFFESVLAEPIKNKDGAVTAAQVNAVIRNSLAPLDNTVVKLRVRRNEKQIEEVDVQKIATLALGATEVKYRYVPVDGWQPGTYSFEMRLDNGPISIAAMQVPKLVVPEGLPWWVKWLALALALVLVMLIVGWWRRRRRRELEAAGVPTRAERRAAARQAKRDAARAQEERKRAERREKKERKRVKGGPADAPESPPEPSPPPPEPSPPAPVPSPPATGRDEGLEAMLRRAGVAESRAATVALAPVAAPTPPDAPAPDAPDLRGPTCAPPLATPMPSGPLPPGLAPPLPPARRPSVTEGPMPTPPSNYGSIMAGVPPEPGAPADAGASPTPGGAPCAPDTPARAPDDDRRAPLWSRPGG